MDDSGNKPNTDGEQKPAILKQVGGELSTMSGNAPGESGLVIPPELPILPLRGLVVFPETITPLIVGQARSVHLVDDVVGGDRLVGLVASHNAEQETPGPDEVYRIGTVAAVHRLFRVQDGSLRLLVQGLVRFHIDDFTSTDPYLKARVTARPESGEHNIEIEALTRSLGEQFRRMAELVPNMPEELLASILSLEDPLQLAYSIANYIRIDLKDAQDLLEIDSLQQKLERLVKLLEKELEVLELGRKIQSNAQSAIDKGQREYILREQLKAIQRELGEADEQQIDVEEFRKKIEQSAMPEEASREAHRELDRLSKLPTAAAEYGVIRTYLDWLTSLPWNVSTEDNLDVTHAREVLDEDHYGLDDIKQRILEFLAVRKLRKERGDQAPSEDHVRREREGVILCFVGPPGVGKTSLGTSIARAMGRKFVRLSLGGVRDEAELRGHRRTYIGALPGNIIQTLRRVSSKNPVFMLDEVDKLGMDYHGDPASALLEILDPEQNNAFRDHYLDVPFDLSQVMFITTANTLETVPIPLLDRMEILQLSGYTESEKIHIAQNYLVKRQIRENSLRPEEVEFTAEGIQAIIRDFTREAGVRSLEREIGNICRKIVMQIAEGNSGTITVDPEAVREYLGKPKFYYLTEIEERTTLPGVATGLVWTPVGGDVVFIEAAQMPGGKGFVVTGQIGEVMQESARAALSYIRSRSTDLGIKGDWFDHHDVHVHIPAGSVPKDGPSAGITIATALASLVTQRVVRSNVAMTGEITLRGQVLPIGGLKEKVLAAHRFGLDTVIIPKHNEKDLDDIPDEIRKQMKFIPVDHVDQVLNNALGDVVSTGNGPKPRKSKKNQRLLETS